MGEIYFSRISKDYLPELYKMRNSKELMPYFRQYSEISRETHLAWFEGLRTDRTMEMFAIFSSHSNDLIGCCGLTSIDYINSRAEFSLYIHPEKQRMGFGRKALGKLLDFAFDTLNIFQVWGESFSYNPARKLFTEIGMTEDGIKRNFYFKNGEYIDAYLYSITVDEWYMTKSYDSAQSSVEVSDD